MNFINLYHFWLKKAPSTVPNINTFTNNTITVSTDKHKSNGAYLSTGRIK